MKVLNVQKGKFGRFMHKNGAYFVLALVLVATCAAVWLGTGKIRQSLIAQNRSQISLSGDDENCSYSSKKTISVRQTDVPQASSSPSSSQAASSLSSKPSASSGSSPSPSGQEDSQQLLFILPVNGKVLHDFSGDTPVKSKTMGDWRLHTGIDLAAEAGTSVRSAAEGSVLKIYDDDLWGTTVEVAHPNGLVSVYSSLSKKVMVKKGQAVESGQVLGTVGNTAKIEMSEESHLHFAVRRDGVPINPAQVLTAAF